MEQGIEKRKRIKRKIEENQAFTARGGDRRRASLIYGDFSAADFLLFPFFSQL
jgi:hypothetical protein